VSGLVYRIGYGAAWLFANAFFRVYFRYRVVDRPRLSGPFVVVANHTSFLDPVLVGAGLHRRCAFMMTELFYRSPRFHPLYRFFRSIPVSVRGGNRDALRAARDVLARGDVIGVFPEGALSRDGELFLGNPGAVALVLAEGVPVVPAGIVGAHDAFGVHRKFPRPKRVEIRFGTPIPAAELTGPEGAGRKQRLSHATERIMSAIAELSEQQPREAVVRAARRVTA
jgi:1-acyl-sn-glycerol-3-phosphate acyltransferase